MSSREWHPHTDRRSAPRLRFNRQLAVGEFDPFLHADEAKAVSPPRSLDIEANAPIADDEVNPAFGPPELHPALLGPAVLGRIMESLLENPEQGEGNSRRHVAWDVMAFEMDGDVLLAREFTAGESYARDESQQIQF